MADYRSMFDYKYIGAWSLQGKDVTLQIEKVRGETLRNKQGADKKPVIYFKGSDKGYAVNKTSAQTIAAMYGPNTDNWIGKRITLYATNVDVGGKSVPAIRVRPVVPKGKAQELADVPVDQAMRAQQEEAIAVVTPHDPDTGEVSNGT